MRPKTWLFMLCALLGSMAFGQTAQNEMPQLNHFDTSIVDKNLDPCQNFYKFVCSSLLLQEGPADGQRAGLPGLVISEIAPL